MANAQLTDWYTKFLAALRNLSTESDGYKNAINNSRGVAGAGRALENAVTTIKSVRVPLINILMLSNTSPASIQTIMKSFDAIVGNIKGPLGSPENNIKVANALKAWATKNILPLSKLATNNILPLSKF